VLWGNSGDEADNALILEADLTAVGSATLKFDNYLDIEEHWDFGVVQVSTDGGQTWKSLANENTSSDVVEDGYPKIKANLPGFTGNFKVWQKESFDLSAYAGQKVLVSFRYLTDWGHTEGGSTDAFQSMQEILGQYVNYTVTLINEKEVGNKNGKKTNYKVITVDPFNVTEEDALTLRQLFQDGKS
jgi:bacillopeptidase F (M6 metalloprotease family)